MLDAPTVASGSSCPKDRVRPRPTLAAVATSLGYTSDWHWAWARYKDVVVALSEAYGLSRHFEVGGGRDPLFTPAEAEELGLDITLNDIAADELARAPAAFRKLRHDIAGVDTMRFVEPEAYDFAYSRMVMEHVGSARRLWENQYALLAPGGVALAFFPTLYAPAFALNKLVPERLSSAIVARLFPDRHDEGDNPKFPALYDRCHGRAAPFDAMLGAIGFRQVLVLPFYGYSYFDGLPGLREVDRAFTRLCRERDWRTFTSFAYVIAEK